MTLANCSGKEMEVKASFKLNGNFSKYKFFAIPGQKDPSKVKSLAPYEVIGCIVALDKDTAEKVLKKYPRSVMKKCTEAEKHIALIEKQRAFRNPEKASKKNLLTVFIPTRVTSHERSLMEDLYNIIFTLQEVKKDGKVKTFGYISKKGLVKDIPSDEERLKPGDRSAVLDLSRLLGKGEHSVRIYSAYGKEPFYSFATAELICDGEEKSVEFMNELEEDRAYLNWHISVK